MTPEEPRSTVLYVDDDDAMRRLVGKIFEKAARRERLLLAASGTEALGVAQTTELDLVLLDLTLPDCNGEDILLELKNHHGIPVIICSGHADEITQRRLSALGADAYLTKPFEPHDLLAQIGSLLGTGADRPE